MKMKQWIVHATLQVTGDGWLMEELEEKRYQKKTILMLLFKCKINSIQYLQTKHCLHGDEEGWYVKCLKKYLQHKPSWDKYMYQAHNIVLITVSCSKICFSENDCFCSYHYYWKPITTLKKEFYLCSFLSVSSWI